MHTCQAGVLSLHWLAPLSKLIHLRLTGIHCFGQKEHTQAVSLCPGLTSLSLEAFGDNVGQLHGLTRLRHLSLSGSSSGVPTMWGRQLTLSTLCKLTSLHLFRYNHAHP